MLIGIAGRSQAGKDTVADHLVNCGIVNRKIPLARYLKKLCHEMFNIPMDDLYEGKDKLTNIKVGESLIQMAPSLSSRSGTFLTVREILQYIGTDVLRSIQPNCWVNATFNSIEDDESVVISDVRFPNEIKAIQDRGGIVIRLTRKPTNMDHSSETLLDNYDGFDIVYHNDCETVEETLNGCVEAISRYLKYSGRNHEA